MTGAKGKTACIAITVGNLRLFELVRSRYGVTLLSVGANNDATRIFGESLVKR